MSTCCWCTTDDSEKTSLLKSYAVKSLPADELAAANEDLCYCLECVDGYHKARDEVPSLHEVLWELETTRLILHFEKTMAGDGEDDDLFIVEEDGETPFPCYTGPLSFEKHLRVPLLEILKYPYLLLDKRLSELCVLALCEMEKNNYSYQVMDKHPGIYLLMVHPNEVIRRWAILTARNLGKVDRDDYYDIQEVLTCLFKVIELGLFESPDIYSSSVVEKGKLILLPSHLYDTSNYKNYWLGICMLLTVLEEQAMDSLLLGPDKQINFVQSIMSVMEKPADDQSNDPFWPALHCFMVILDKLGSKVWGQPFDPVEAFQTIIHNPSYENEIKSIRESCTRTKSEPQSNYGDEMMTCSQIVYDYQTEKPQKDVGWKSAICPDYCPNLYEDMQTVADMLQYDVGQDMRLHNSTFLWFIPFVHSIMDLREGVAYSGEVLHHLCSEIKEIHNAAFQYFDKVSEFFMWILVSVVELYHNKNCLHLLWITSSMWVEAVVKCAVLPSEAFLHGAERSARNYSRATTPALSQGCVSIQSACMKLIRSLLKEGYQLGQKTTCEPFLNKLNVLLRCDASRHEGWLLTVQERRDLQVCLKQVMKSIKDKWSQSAASGENTGVCVTSPTLSIKQEKGILESRCPVTVCHEHPSALRGNEVGQEGTLSRSNGVGEMSKEASCRAQIGRGLCRTPEYLLTNIKQEPGESPVQERKNLNCSKLANEQKDAQENGHPTQNGQSKRTASSIRCSDQGIQHLKTREINEEERLRTSKCLTIPEKNHNDRNGGGSTSSEINTNKIKLEKPSLILKLKEKIKRKKPMLGSAGEKPQLVKGGSGVGLKGQKGEESGASCSTSGVLQPKAEESSASAFQVDPLSMDRSTDLRSTLKGDRDLQENDDDPRDNVPLKMILQELRSKESASAASPMTDSQVDADLSKLSLATYASVINFPVDSSQESSMHCQSHIKRKVQGVARSLSVDQSPDAGEPTNQVITISDSEEEESREPMKEKAGVCLEKQSSKVLERAQGQAPSTTSSSPLPSEECASQLFEFETEEEMYSVWQDSQMEEKMEEEPGPSVKTSRPIASGDLEAVQQINDWGYDTDYLGDEVTEKAAEVLEQQVKYGKTEKQQVQTSKGSKADATPEASVDKEPVGKGGVVSRAEHFTGVHAKDGERSRHKDLVRPSTSTPAVKKSSLGKSFAKSQRVKAGQSPKKRSLKPSAGNTQSLQAKPFRSDSTEAPSRKDPHCQQSTVEKHGQKKTSQSEFGHSKDSVAKSHSSWKTTSESRLPEKKAKLIPAQKLVGKNRKMLACQDRPCQQSTVEKLGLKKAPRKALELSQHSLDNVAQLRNYGKAVGDLGLPQKKAQKRDGKNRKMFARQERLPRQSGSKESKEEQRAHRATKIAKNALPKQCVQSPTSRMVAEDRKEGAEHVGGSLSSEKNQLRQSSLEKEGFQLPPEPPLTRQDSTNPDTSIQGRSAAVPVLPGTSCSSVTDGRKRDLVDVAISPSSHCDEGADPKESTSKLNENVDEDDGLFLTQMDAVDMELCSQEENDIEMEGNVLQSPLQGRSSPEICNHAGCSEKVSRAGASCREHLAPDPLNYVFTKPSAPARLPTAKRFASSSSSRNANLAKELGNSSKCPVARNVSSSSASKANGFRSQTPTFSSILRPQNSNNAPQSWSMQNNHISDIPKRPAVLGTSAGQEVRLHSLQPCSVNAQQRDFKMFIKEVLKWNYSMFANFSQTGPPDDFRQSIVGPVPLTFQDYNDYFNTFFPLMMLNAFETVAQDWLEIRKSIEQKSFILSLVSCSANVWSAHFTVDISENDLANQRHPKEDDLVFLTVSEKQSPSCEEETREVCYVGLVTQFRSGNPTKKKVVCHLSIQTQGNLFRVSKQVKCVVVSSLLMTQRRFRALLLFRRSPLYKPILSPKYDYFCPRDLKADTKNTASSEFNEDQRRAIETAYAIVTQEPSVPSICLIHGPPGTGKSKTILGLLDRILNDRSQTENSAPHLHTRRKHNRVLVCAPSNAAIDELMKKIILVFKEKCRDTKKCLGNCGDVNLVRLGQEKSIHRDVRHFSLYELVERRINKKKLGEDQGCPKEKKAELDHQLDILSRQRAMVGREDNEKRRQLEEEICRLSKKRQQLASQMKQVHGRSQELKATIILESNIICCTLSMSGLPLLESTFRRQGYDPFSCVIVDEAGQSCEIETLIPLIHGCKKLVLVGDPKQLPPTVKSRKAQDNGYDQSLMGRLCRHLEEQNWGNKLILQLTIQYRMHPDLCIFPSKYIYSGKLVTAEETESNRGSLEWPFLSYMLFDVYDGQEVQDSGSFANPREVRMVVELIKLIKEKISHFQNIGIMTRFHNIGIITPYNAQKRKIMKELETEFGTDRTWEVDTVDGFQGREKSCIIMSCVRARRDDRLGGSIGFLRNVHRLNVAITRAKFSLFILGHLETLRDNHDWNALIHDAEKRGAITKTSSNTYKEALPKIVKTLAQTAVVPQRPLQVPTGAAAGRRNEVPSRDSGPLPAKAGALPEGSSGVQPSPASRDSSSSSSSKKPPVPTQAKPVGERLQDPRLARRAEPATKGAACREETLPASSSGSGVVLPQNPDAPLGQRTWSNITTSSASWGETTSKPQGECLPATRDPDRRVPVTTEEAKTLDRRDHCFGSRRTSEEPLEGRSPLDAKRRRTTY